MIGFSKLTAASLTILLLGLGWASIAQVQNQVQNQEKPKAKPPATKAAPKPGPTKPDEAKKADPPAKAAPNGEAGETEDSASHSEIQQSAEAFVEAYNKHDAKAVAVLFAEKAEFFDEDGNLVKGRDAIEQTFAAMFEEFPEGKIALDIESIRVLTPHIALEEGVVIGTPVPDGPAVLTNYTAVHYKGEDGWKLASVSDTDAAVEELTAHDHLQQLAWMVGDWIDESPDAIIKSSCDWDASGNYLLHEFAVQISGGMSASGSIRIGWDPLTRQLKSWIFDADSGYSEGLWTRIGDEWVVHSHGVDSDGQATSSISVYRYIDDDTMSWRSYDRTVGGEPDEDISENIIKRHPPVPEIEAAAAPEPQQ